MMTLLLCTAKSKSLSCFLNESHRTKFHILSIWVSRERTVISNYFLVDKSIDIDDSDSNDDDDNDDDDDRNDNDDNDKNRDDNDGIGISISRAADRVDKRFQTILLTHSTCMTSPQWREELINYIAAILTEQRRQHGALAFIKVFLQMRTGLRQIGHTKHISSILLI